MGGLLKTLAVLLILLCVAVPSESIPETGIFMISKSLFLMPYGYYSQPIVVQGRGVQLYVGVNSSEPVDAYVLSSSQYDSFSSTGKSGSLFSSSGTTIWGKVDLGVAGEYYLVLLENQTLFPAIVTLSYATVPVSVHVLYSSAPAPVGVADYGVANSSGYLVPYRLSAREVLGQANISELKAYNPLFVSPYSASLQLNAVLVVNTTAGSQDYLLQNVVEFLTNASTFKLADNVWNITSPSSYVSDSKIRGKGAVATEPWVPPWARSTASVYSYVTGSAKYTLPISLLLETSVSDESGNVVIEFGATEDGSGGIYDVVRIAVGGLEGASLLVSGYSMTPVGNYYDAELVFGGGYGGEATEFTSMSSQLSLAYVLTNGTSVLPRSLYGFGSDTAESAYNLLTTCIHGQPEVQIGKPNLYLSFSKLDYPIPSPIKEAPEEKPVSPVFALDALLLSAALLFSLYLEAETRRWARGPFSAGKPLSGESPQVAPRGSCLVRRGGGQRVPLDIAMESFVS
ncbi:MAG: thermopsin [Thermoprotei archaeon]